MRASRKTGQSNFRTPVPPLMRFFNALNTKKYRRFWVPEENNSVDPFRKSIETRSIRCSRTWCHVTGWLVSHVSGLLLFFGNLGHQSPSDTVHIRDEQRPQTPRYGSPKASKDIEICVSIRELNRSRLLANMHNKSRTWQYCKYGQMN